MVPHILTQFLCLLIGIGLVTSQAPSASEYQRAKNVITDMVEGNQDLPRVVRLGMLVMIIILYRCTANKIRPDKHSMRLRNFFKCFSLSWLRWPKWLRWLYQWWPSRKWWTSRNQKPTSESSFKSWVSSKKEKRPLAR